MNQDALIKFRKITARHALFRLLFFALVTVQLLSFLSLASFSSPSLLLAILLGTLFLTSFLYFVLHFYLQAKKPDQFDQFQEWFFSLDKKSATERALELTCMLEGQEETYYAFPSFFKPMTLLLQKMSRKWHQKDIFEMREKLLFSAIEAQLREVKKNPLDPAFHATLGSLYFSLSDLYLENEKEEGKQKEILLRALSEFKIVQSFMPEDPWVYTQLALAYTALSLSREALSALELVHKLCPDNHEILCDMGILHFKEGFLAEGLKIYETLKHFDSALADQLIAHYDTFFLEFKKT